MSVEGPPDSGISSRVNPGASERADEFGQMLLESNDAGLNIFDFSRRNDSNVGVPTPENYILDDLMQEGAKFAFEWKDEEESMPKVHVNAGSDASWVQLGREFEAVRKKLIEIGAIEVNNNNFAGDEPAYRIFNHMYGDNGQFGSPFQKMGWSRKTIRDFIGTSLSFSIYGNPSLDEVYSSNGSKRFNRAEYFPMGKEEYLKCWEEIKKYGYEDDGKPSHKEFLTLIRRLYCV